MEGKQSAGEDVSSATAVLLGALAPGVNGPTWNTLKVAFLMLGVCLCAMLGLAFSSSDSTLVLHVTLLVLITCTLFFLLSRFPSRIGTCTTPMELTSSQLIASEVIPSGVVKALLYPGAIGKAILNNKPIPKYNNLLDAYKLRKLRQSPSTNDLQHIEVLAGSYLAVAGAIIGLFRSRRLGLFGMLLLIWGLSKEPYLSKGHAAFKHHKNAISIYYPTMSIAILSAFLSIRDDVKKIISCFKWTFSKSKYK